MKKRQYMTAHCVVVEMDPVQMLAQSNVVENTPEDGLVGDVKGQVLPPQPIDLWDDEW